MIKVLISLVFLAATAGITTAQTVVVVPPDPHVAELTLEVAQLTKIAEVNMYQLQQQQATIEHLTQLLEAQQPRHHRRSVTILLRALAIIDHSGSIASIYGVILH